MTDSFCFLSHIQRFSVDDGPGIRSTVFFKGCNLACQWCHNPECISPGPSLCYEEKFCLLCGNCRSVCPQHVHQLAGSGHYLLRDRCLICGECVRACPSAALSLIGKIYTPPELLEILLRDYPYYETSGGGVTFSGGEPMLQPEALVRVLRLCKAKGLHTAVDTAGNVPFSSFDLVRLYTDLFLYDVKLFNREKHKRATRSNNCRILENLRRLLNQGSAVYVRVPVIRSVNDDPGELKAIADFLAQDKKPELVQLLPYHAYGEGKYAALGLSYSLSGLASPGADELEEALRIFKAAGLSVEIS